MKQWQVLHSTVWHICSRTSRAIMDKFLPSKLGANYPTVVSHLVVVVGLCTDEPKDFWNLEARSLLSADQNVRADCYMLPVLLCWFQLHSRLRLYSSLFKALQPSVYGFIPVYGFIAATCNHVVTFGDAHWAKLIRPQRWAGVRACPPRRYVR